jgi:hypothetical protein
MSDLNKTPVVLELAPLPREQAGPFLLLGVDKLADKEQIEANWAQRVIWARKGQSKVPLEDINWARESLNDLEKRIRADAASLNADTTAGTLQRLVQQYAGKTSSTGDCVLLDVEKALGDYTPPAEIPDANELRRAIAIPDVPQEFPAIQQILDQFLAEPLDPWKLEMRSEPSGTSSDRVH